MSKSFRQIYFTVKIIVETIYYFITKKQNFACKFQNSLAQLQHLAFERASLSARGNVEFEQVQF